LNAPLSIEVRRGPTTAYNCHGLTFLLRRAWLVEEDDETLTTVLRDDGFVQIAPEDVKPGDIAVYYDRNGEIEHTGVVVTADHGSQTIRVVSKWSRLHEIIHPWNDCPYTLNVRFINAADMAAYLLSHLEPSNLLGSDSHGRFDRGLPRSATAA